MVWNYSIGKCSNCWVRCCDATVPRRRYKISTSGVKAHQQ